MTLLDAEVCTAQGHFMFRRDNTPDALTIGVVAVALLGPFGGGGCSSSKVGDTDSGISSDSGDSQYNTLKGTFVAPGVDVKFSGAMQGTYVNPGGQYDTTWTATGGALQFNVSGMPPKPTVTGTFPSGGTPLLIINVTNIKAAPAAGTFACTNVNDEATVSFSVTTSAGAILEEYDAIKCNLTFDDVANAHNSHYPSVSFSHGSMSATLAQRIPAGSKNTGTMSATW
jgi:hypothetical protein